MTKKELGERLKRLWEKRNLTQKQIADSVNIPEQSYQRYEYGRVEPKVLIAKEIANTLSVSLDFLVSNTDDKDNEEQ